MDEEPEKSHKILSMLEMSEMFDKVQNRIGSLSYNFEKSNSLLGIVSQYEYLNSATSIADIVAKTVQPVDFASVNVVNHSALANCDQLRISEAMAYNLADASSLLRVTGQYEHLNSAANIADIASKAVRPIGFASIGITDHSELARCAQLKIPEVKAIQDTFLEMTKGVSPYNNNLMSLRESFIQSTGGTNVYENMMSSVNLIRDSLEPYRSAFDAVRTSFEASESFKIARELQSQAFLANSLSTEYSTIFEQLESLRNLESFKAISRLKNFPKDNIWQQDYSEVHEITESSIVEARKIDAEISDEILSVNDFNDLSEETQNSLKQVFSEHYEYFIMKIIVSLCLLQENLNKDLDLSNKSFIFVNRLEGSVFFIGSYWSQNKAAIINGLITTAIYNALIWLFFIK